MVKSVWVVMKANWLGGYILHSIHSTEHTAEKELERLNDDGYPGHTLGPYVVRE